MGHAELTICATKPPLTPGLARRVLDAVHAEPRVQVRSARSSFAPKACIYWNDRGDKIIDASSGLFCVAAGHGRKEIADAVGNAAARARFHRAVPARPSEAVRARDARRRADAGRPQPHLLRQLRLGSGRHRDEGRARLPPGARPGRPQHVRLARARVPRRQFRRRLAVGPRQQPPPVRPDAARHRAHAAHAPEGKLLHAAAKARTASSWPTICVRFVNLYGAENIAACFVEPIAGSTGCLVPPKGYLKRLREICDAHGILLVFDEVICGFGRTGQTFAAQSFGVTPDLMTMAKGITNGAQPMGAVAVSERIHDTIMGAGAGRRDRVLPRLHVFGTSGAVRGRPRDARHLPERRPVRARRASCRRTSSTRSSRCKDVPVVADIRGYGMFAAIDVHPDGAPGKRGHVFQKKLFDNGLHLKTTGDCGDHRAAADRREDACRHHRRHLAQDAGRRSRRAHATLDNEGHDGSSMKRLLASADWRRGGGDRRRCRHWRRKTVTFAYQDMMNPVPLGAAEPARSRRRPATRSTGASSAAAAT